MKMSLEQKRVFIDKELHDKIIEFAKKEFITKGTRARNQKPLYMSFKSAINVYINKLENSK